MAFWVYSMAAVAGPFNTDSLRGTWVVDIEATEAFLLKNPPPQSRDSDWFGMTFGIVLQTIYEFGNNSLSVSLYTIPEKRTIPLASSGNNELVYSLENREDKNKTVTFVVTPVDSEHIRVVVNPDVFSPYVVWKRASLDPNRRVEDGRKMLEKYKEVAPRFQEIFNKGAHKEATWVDEALLHDGRTVEVQRKVAFYRNSPDEYSLQVKHLDTGRSIAWSGERYLHPVLLDFVNGTAYIAVFSAREIYLKPELFGCPELPYLFYKYDESSSRWRLVPAASVPEVLNRANLSMRYDGTYMKDGARQSKSNIANRNPLYSSATGGLFDVTIPRRLDEWHYPRKARFVNERYPGDCRPPLPKPVDSINPKDPKPESRRVSLEILKSTDFNPDWVLSTDSGTGPSEWAKYVFDSDRSKACSAFFKPANRDDPQFDGWKAFVNDKTEKKVTAAQGNMICDENVIWLIDYVGGGDQMLIIKATPTGDVVYRASFPFPESLKGYIGAIAAPTLRASNGYVHFEWWYSNSNPRQRLVKRVLKARFREP